MALTLREKLATELGGDDRALQQLSAAEHLRFGGDPNRPIGQEMLEIVHAFHRVSRQGDEDILLLESGAVGRPVRVQPDNPDATVLVELVVAVDAAADRPGLTPNGPIGPDHAAGPN